MLLVIATIFLGSLIYFVSARSSQVSNKRLSRAARVGAAVNKTSNEARSILHERYKLLNRSKRTVGPRILIELIFRFYDLFNSSGIRLSGRSFGLICLLVYCLFSAFLIFSTTVASLLTHFIFSIVYIVSLVYLLTILRERQLRRFQECFPDALDLIVRNLKAGLPVSEAIKVIGNDLPAPVGTAFQRIANNLSIGMSLEEALSIFQKSVPLVEVRFFSITLSIQQETGGNLGEIVGNLANAMRKRQQMKRKIRAFSSEARASALIIGSLPFIVGFLIYIINPDYIGVLVFDDAGRLFLIAALVSIAIGAFVISKLIRFDI